MAQEAISVRAQQVGLLQQRNPAQESAGKPPHSKRENAIRTIRMAFPASLGKINQSAATRAGASGVCPERMRMLKNDR
jgi:hypothetical protein